VRLLILILFSSTSFEFLVAYVYGKFINWSVKWTQSSSDWKRMQLSGTTKYAKPYQS